MGMKKGNYYIVVIPHNGDDTPQEKMCSFEERKKIFTQQT